MLTAGLAVTALVAFSGVADAAIIVNGVAQSDPYTTSGVSTLLNNRRTNTIDGGSTWTHNDDIMIIGHTVETTLTISGGGWLKGTVVSPGDTYGFTLGNQTNGAGVVLVTGTGSKMTAAAPIAVGRRPGSPTTTPSYLTIEAGDLVQADGLVYGRDSGGEGYVRMGDGGILAILGTGKSLSQMVTLGNAGGSGRSSLVRYRDRNRYRN